MHHADIHWAAVPVAALTFMIGGLWYSRALFGLTWAREAGMPIPEKGAPPEKGKHPAAVFGAAYAFSLLASIGMSWLIGRNGSLHAAVHHGLLVGVMFVATSFGINYRFAQRSWTMWAIDAGYHVLQFTLIALVFGLWP